MVADQITKEEAARFILSLKDQESNAAERTATANILATVFQNIEDIDLSDFEVNGEEAEDILSGVFESEEFGL